MVDIFKMSVDVGNTLSGVKGIDAAYKALNATLKELSIVSRDISFGTKGGINGDDIVLKGLDEFSNKIEVKLKKVKDGYRVRKVGVNIEVDKEKLKRDKERALAILKQVADEIQTGYTKQNYEDAAVKTKTIGKQFKTTLGSSGQFDTATATKAQEDALVRARNNVTKLIAEGKVAEAVIDDITKSIAEQKSYKFAPDNKEEIKALNTILALHTAIYNIAKNSTAKKAKDPIALERDSRTQAGVFNRLLDRNLAQNKNVGVAPFTAEQAETLALKTNNLQGALVGAELDAKRVTEILDAVVQKNIASLGTLSRKEREVVKAAVGVSRAYTQIGKDADKAAEQATKAAEKREAAEKKANEAEQASQDKLTFEYVRQQELKAAKAKKEREQRQKDEDKDAKDTMARLKKLGDFEAKQEERKAKSIRKGESVALSGDLTNQLGGLKDDFTKQGTLSIQRANLELQKFYQTSTIARDRFEQLFNAIQTNSVKSLGTLTTEELKAEIALRRLINAFNSATTAGKRTSEMMISLRTGFRLLAIQQVHLAISKATNALLAAVEGGKEYEIRLAEIQTITQNASRSTAQWSASLVNLSNNFGTDLLRTTEAAYEALSNQISKGAGVTTFLAEALTFARTTASTADQAVNLLSSTINAYGTSAVSAERYSAVLFKLIDLGRVRAGELANTFGNTATLAYTMGLSIEELSASLATLTIQGIRGDTSMTLVNNIMLKLLKPTKEMTKLFNEWGVESGEAAVRTFGFQGVLQRLDSELQKGGLTRLGEIVSDMRAIRGATGLTGEALEKYKSNLIQMTESQSAYNEAARLTANTVANELNKEMAALNNLFVADAVQKYNKIFATFAKDIGGVANSLKPFVDAGINMVLISAKISSAVINLSNTLAKFGGGIETLLPTLGAMFVGLKIAPALTVAWSASMTFLNATLGTAAARAAILTSITQFLTGATTAATLSTWALAAAQSAVTFGIPLLLGGLAYMVSSSQLASSAMADLAATTEGALNALAQESLKKLNSTIDAENLAFENGIKERQQLFDRYVAAIRSALNENLGEKLKQVLDPNIQKSKERDFELSLVGKDDDQQLELTRQRVEALKNEIQILAQAGDSEAVEKRFESMAEAAKSFTDEAQRGLDKVNKELAKFDKDSANKALEGQLKGLSDPKKAAKIAELVQQLRKESKELADKGGTDETGKSNLQTAKEKIQEAEKLNAQLIALTDKGAKKGKGKQQGVEEEAAIRAEQRIILLKQQEEFDKKVKEGRALEKEAMDQSIEGMSDLAKKTKAFKEETIAAAEQVKLLNEQIQNLGKTKAETTGLVTGTGATLAGAAKAFAAQTDTFRDSNRVVEVDELTKTLKQAVAAYEDTAKNDKDNISKLNEQSELIKEAFNNLLNVVVTDAQGGVPLLQQKDAAGETLEAKVRNVRNAGDANTDAQAALNTVTVQRDNLLAQQGQIQANLDASVASIKALATTVTGAEEAFGRSFERGAVTFEQTIGRLQETNQNLINALEAQRDNNFGKDRKSNGGMLNFSGGGMLRGPLGRDNKVFGGHDGESVNSKEATTKFYSQISAMNSGGNGARGLMSNGPTINVGDINMTMGGNNTQKNVQEFGRELRRAIRSGSVKI
jgi:hypothetical protein